MATFSIVVATDLYRGIGQDGHLPWTLKGDMRWFRELTTCPERPAVQARYRLDVAIRDMHPLTVEQLVARIGKEPGLLTPGPDSRNAVIMGRKTWEGLPERFRPLPGRLNGVLSAADNIKSDGTFKQWASLDEALVQLDQDPTIREIYVIGGGQVYADAILNPNCQRIYRTQINAEVACDTFFPVTPPRFCEVATTPPLIEGDWSYRIQMFEAREAAL